MGKRPFWLQHADCTRCLASQGAPSAGSATTATSSCCHLLVLMNTEVFFILLKKFLLHIPWVSGVKAHVTMTKSDSWASFVTGTGRRNTDHSSAHSHHQDASAALLTHKEHQERMLPCKSCANLFLQMERHRSGRHEMNCTETLLQIQLWCFVFTSKFIQSEI